MTFSNVCSDTEPSSELTSQRPDAKIVDLSISISLPDSPCVADGAAVEGAKEDTNSEQVATQEQKTTLTEFHLFPKLAPELRQMIFKLALPTGHDGERIIPLDLDIGYEPGLTGLARVKFDVERNANTEYRRCHDVYDVSLSATDHEARAVYLSHNSCSVALNKGLIRFSPETGVFVPSLGRVLLDRDLKSMLTNETRDLHLLQGVEVLVLQDFFLCQKMLSTLVYVRGQSDFWFEYLMRFKSVALLCDKPATLKIKNMLMDPFKKAFEVYQRKNGVLGQGPEFVFFDNERITKPQPRI